MWRSIGAAAFLFAVLSLASERTAVAAKLMPHWFENALRLKEFKNGEAGDGMANIAEVLYSIDSKVERGWQSFDRALAHGPSEAAALLSPTQFSLTLSPTRRDHEPGVYLLGWAVALVAVLVGYKVTEHIQLGIGWMIPKKCWPV